MTMVALPHVLGRPETARRHSGGRLLRAIRSYRRPAAAPAARTAPVVPVLLTAPAVRGSLRLTLHDGTPRRYLLDARDFAATTSPDVAYDARVHTAYLLAMQGHRAPWLAQHLDLPSTAAHAIAERAARSGTGQPAPDA
ncbi:hypothetical protein ACIGXM_27965 [Kitasatospora sp. NPDC052896]|uniref:hypothetical protein n=1 Tax=Kitasatospora sp. NPDC052896 TaxID=3364061 RepID=UPI0037CA8000